MDKAKQALTLMQQTRTLLIMSRSPQNVMKPGSPGMTAFFAMLAMRLRLEPTDQVDRAATDGKALKFNPEFTVSLTPEGRMAVMVHEIKHLILKHHARCEGRDLEKWNLACDLAINPQLLELGFQLPDASIVPGAGPFAHMPGGKTAEWYYANLKNDKGGKGGKGGGGGGAGKQQQKQPGGGQGQGQGKQQQPGQGQGKAGGEGDGGGNGDVQPAGDGSQAAQTESASDWEVAVAQAHRFAKQRGTLPASLDRLVAEALKPKVDWKEVLREFVSRQAKNDYRWTPPNRRYVHAGLYLPGMRSEEMGDLVVAVDTSGSIDTNLLRQFSGEIQAIVEAYNAKCHVVYCDARINAVDTYSAEDGPLVMKAVGGGGTSHRPVFEWVEKHGGESACVVCLTDLYTDFPDREPQIPVLWCVYGNPRPQAPFGQVVAVE